MNFQVNAHVFSHHAYGFLHHPRGFLHNPKIFHAISQSFHIIHRSFHSTNGVLHTSHKVFPQNSQDFSTHFTRCSTDLIFFAQVSYDFLFETYFYQFSRTSTFVWHFHTSLTLPPITFIVFSPNFMGFSALYIFHKFHRPFTHFTGYTSSSLFPHIIGISVDFIRSSSIFMAFFQDFPGFFPGFCQVFSSCFQLPRPNAPTPQAGLEA